MESIVFILGLLGLVPYVSAIVSLVQIRRLRQRLQLHEAIITSLSNRLAELQTAPLAPQPANGADAADVFSVTAHAPAVSADVEPAIDHTLNVDITPPPAHAPSPTRDELEMAIGGTWLSRIGAVAIVLGALFFLKFAFDNGWITEPMRVLIGAVVGFGLVAGSERWRTKGLQMFAQGLAGAGIPVLYLAVYASYGFYDLVSQPVALGLMSIVTVIAVFTSLRHESVFIASMAAIGGMLTPTWLSTGDVNTVGLFGYLVMLFIGLLWLGYRRPSWWSVPPIGYLGVWVYWNQWMGLRSGMSDPDMTEGTLLAFLFLVSGLVYHYLMEQQPLDQLISARRVFIGFHSFIMYTMINRAMMSDSPWINGGTAALLGMLFVATALMYHRDDNTNATSMFALFALVALDHACCFFENTYHVSIGLSLLSLTAMLIVRHRERTPEVIAVILIVIQSLAVAILEAISHSFPAAAAIPLLNFRSAALVFAATGLILSSRYVQTTLRLTELATSIVAAVGFIMMIWAAHLDVFGLFANTDNVARPMIEAVRTWPDAFGHAITSACSVVLGCLLVATPMRHRQDAAVLGGIVVVVGASIWWLTHASALTDPSELAPFASIRTLTGVLIIGSMIMCIRAVKRPSSVLNVVSLKSILGALAIGFSFVFVTMETVWHDVIRIHLINAGVVEGSVRDGWNRFHLMMSGTWIGYSILLMIAGFARRLRHIRVGALILLFITILKVFLYDLSFLQQPYRIVSFITLGVILMLAGYMYQRFKRLILADVT